MAVLRQSSRYAEKSIHEDPELFGILEIFVHHARNIHNICIYDKQDVYAKFSLTYNPDDAIATKIIIGGGKNPEFNEKVSIKVNKMDAVLKCEIWMLSRLRKLLEDQLLGFALVPTSMVAAANNNGKLSEEFSLSSTDLIHSPAGIIKLTLSFKTCVPLNHYSRNSSITSEVVLLDRNAVESIPSIADYSSIEFPDMNAVQQNQKMVCEYFNLVSEKLGLVHHGASLEESEMLVKSEEEDLDDSKTINMNTADSGAKISINTVDSELVKCSMDVEAEESAMQQQIVEMYMKSMHQFTESLGNMKLPVNVEKVLPTQMKVEVEKKDVSRVFYGSRAFF